MSTPIEMIEKFQCRGCVSGSDIKCGRFKLEETFGPRLGVRCLSHVPGTVLIGLGAIYLGLPRGFNRVGAQIQDLSNDFKLTALRLWTVGTAPKWDDFNVAVWAMELDGVLYVRTYAPRTNRTYIDVIEKGSR